MIEVAAHPPATAGGIDLVQARQEESALRCERWLRTHPLPQVVLTRKRLVTWRASFCHEKC